ncbi:HAD family phosphatase [Flavobacteriales bacterium]|nr:HAD family phosphatase [Flavobacteriales bacterium]
MTEIKSIIFDLGGVILNLNYSKTEDEFKKIGVLNFKEFYSQKKQTLLFDDLEKGKIKPEEFISSLKESENLNIKEIDFINAWNAMLLEMPIEKLQFIEGLKKDYKIILLSNTNEIHIKKFEDDLKKNNMLEQFYKCFDKIYYSSRMGKRKPEENCFNQVLEENGLIAENTLFIDDSIQHIEGAKKAGIKTFHLEKNKSILDLVPDIIQSKHHQ